MDAENTLAARQGDTVDVLIWRERGLGAADLPAVFEANPGLADHGAVLPLGTLVVVPVTPPAQASRPVVQLWD
ncbi:MAG TPA: tail protein X [Allosphingosinicella sp.]|jgi:phage tail protein X